jgi:hypothetical protein
VTEAVGEVIGVIEVAVVDEMNTKAEVEVEVVIRTPSRYQPLPHNPQAEQRRRFSGRWQYRAHQLWQDPSVAG